MAGGASEWRSGMPFFGGSLWIDFLNTTPVMNGEILDFLADIEGLARWERAAGITTDKNSSVADLRTARDTREALRKLFGQLAKREAISASQLNQINRHLEKLTIREQLIVRADRLCLVQEVENGDSVASAIVRDFAHFACDADPARMKRCANPACNMLFYDRGRNNIRRWCTMALCGNRDKVAHYRVRKEQMK